MLNQFFQSVFIQEDAGTLPEAPMYKYEKELVDFEVTEEADHKTVGITEKQVVPRETENPKISNTGAPSIRGEGGGHKYLHG